MPESLSGSITRDTCNSRTTSRGSNWVTKTIPTEREILADIEARVCELILNQQSADQLVPADRIRDIIEQLGMPDDFPATDNTETDGTGTSIDRNAVLPNEENGSGHSPLPRRLYRNPEGAKLGGVCSGLGTYFNVEPVFIRLAFLAPIPLIPLSAIITHDGHPPLSSRFSSLLFPALFPAVVLHPDGTNPAPKARNAG
ncbi:MAG: PspC domain-containing protein [Alistipes indistinctus]